MPATPATAGKTNLSLGNLRRGMTGSTTSPFSLGVQGRGSSGTPTSMLEFTVSAIGTPSGEQNPILESLEAYALSFTSAGPLFASKLGSRSANSSWSDTNSRGSLNTNNGDDCLYRWDGSTGTTTLRAVWTDFFNLAATSYSANRDLAILVDPGGT